VSSPHVSAVILNYSQYDLTVRCVNDLLRQSYPSINILVVDNASPDESHDRLKKTLSSIRTVNLIRAEKNGGYATGNNLGIRRVIECNSPAYIFLVNPDIELPEPSLIEELVAFAEQHDDAAVVGPRVVLPNGRIQGPYERPSLIWLSAQYLFPPLWLLLRSLRQRQINSINVPTKCFRTIGACMLLRTRDFQAVGMFDEATFLTYEEDILAERFRTLGKSFYYLPNSTALHHHKATYSTSWSLESACYYFSQYRGAGSWRLAALGVSYRVYRNVFHRLAKAVAPHLL